MFDTTVKQLLLSIKNDDDAEVYINGEKVLITGLESDHQLHDIPESVIKKLHRGTNILAMHCTNTVGDAWLGCRHCDTRIN